MAAVLATAWQDDLAEGRDFWRSRQLYFALGDLDPATERFTREWLKVEPDSAFAQTARGVQLATRGWAWRGTDYIGNTAPDRLQKMTELHGQAQGLMRKALARMPDFLPAAEGLINLDLGRGQPDEAIWVFDRAMQAHPNLATLRQAMPMLAPQWGGSATQADLFCDRYAPMVSADPPYDAATCRIDVAFTAPYNGGPRMQEAQEALHQNDSPWLDHARARLAQAPWEDPAWRLQILTRIRSQRPFSAPEAYAWDQLNQTQGRQAPPEYPAAVARDLAQRRQWAANAPESAATLMELAGLMASDTLANATPYPRAEIMARARRVLAAFPQDPDIWQLAAEAQIDTGPRPGPDTLGRLRAAEPYFINAMVYSGYREGAVTAALDPKLRLINQDLYLDAMAQVRLTDLPPRMVAALTRDLYCPTVRQMAILVRVCQATGRLDQGCGGWEAGSATTMQLTDRILAGYCQAELHPQSDMDLAYAPVAVDLGAPVN